MSLKIVDLYDENYISKMGTEYICTGFMFNISEQDQTLASQLASFDFIGVTSGDIGLVGATLEEDFNMSSNQPGFNSSMAANPSKVDY